MALLEQVTGPSRGDVAWLLDERLFVSANPTEGLCLSSQPGTQAPLAELRKDEGTYRLEVSAEQSVWVNGRPVHSAVLRDGDTIEFGETGPMARLRLLPSRHPISRSIDNMIGDMTAYLKSSRKPLGPRVSRAVENFGRQFAHETTVAFRITVIVALIVLSTVAVLQYRSTSDLRESFRQEADVVEQVAAELARTRREALQPGDLTALRDDFDRKVSASLERLDALETETGAIPRVIARSFRSIAFLQGAYGLRDVESGAMLRHVLGPDGLPILLPTGQPLLSMQGNGGIAEVQMTGTGFLIDDSGTLVTNRHVARPWESRMGSGDQAKGPLEPVLLRFIGYLPEVAGPMEIEVLKISDDADLAILRLTNPPPDLTGLHLAPNAPASGDDVILMGYPTGLRSLLAQSGQVFLDDLSQAKDVDFWSVARRLSAAGLIIPLASRGIVGKVTPDAIVYDAETTHGGSGGPVLNRDGNVVAINAAILPEFGGSNLGIPVEWLRQLERQRTN
ncbi:MAG: trypsin-like peptidase domain-containing protein [Pseudomonadota bacterium]